MKSLRDIIKNESCTKCGLYEHSSEVCIIGEGPHPSKIMIIGDSPLNQKALRILSVILEECGIKIGDVYVTHVVHCDPPFLHKIKQDELRACRKYLMKEIKYVKPEIIISLGSITLKGIFDSNLVSISKERGKVIDWEGTKLIPTYHPGGASKNKYFANVIFEDIKNGLARINDKTSSVHVKEAPTYVLVDKNNKDNALRVLKAAPIVACDVETSSLDYMDPKEELRCVGFSPRPYLSFVWRITDTNIRLMNEILSTKQVVANHNIKFDLQWLHRYGIQYKGKIFDTLVAKHLLDENCPDKELKTLARVEEGMYDLSEGEKIIIEHRNKGTTPSWEEYRRYNGGDVDAVMRLMPKYQKQLQEEGLEHLMSTEMKVLKSLTRMEEWGFAIDRQSHKELSIDYAQRIEERADVITRLVGDINLNSPQQLRELLYESLKLPILTRTEKKAPSTAEDALKLLMKKAETKEQRQILKAILKYRGVAKLYNTYLLGLIKNNLLKVDGKVHCNFKICGTVTGRLSCADPNLENIPRDGDIKRMFISSWPKGYLIQVDYSQMELRILAHYANDKRLIKAFQEGRDIHRETTSKCLGKPPDQVTEEERKIIGKKVNFGIVYMIGASGLADKIGVKPKVAQRFINNWFEEFYCVKEWMKERKEQVIETGRSESITGRIRRLYDADPATGEGRQAIRQGVNSPIQGGAGDITKFNMMRLDRKLAKEGLQSRVHNNVHDAVMVDCPNMEEVKECIKHINQLFIEPPVPLRVPLAFEIKVGKNWNELKEWKGGKANG